MSSTTGNTCAAALQITNLHPVVSPVQAGKVLCDSLGRAEDASVLRFDIDSNEVGGLPHGLSVRHLAYQVAKLTPMKIHSGLPAMGFSAAPFCCNTLIFLRSTKLSRFFSNWYNTSIGSRVVHQVHAARDHSPSGRLHHFCFRCAHVRT